MIKLKEILHRLNQEQEENQNLTELDNWKITDYDFMIDMEFKPDGMYHFALKTPNITVAHKKGVGFVLNDKSKDNTQHTFPTFKELSEFFTKYDQKWSHEPYQE